MSDNEGTNLVIDYGVTRTKLGVAGDDAPRSIFSPVVEPNLPTTTTTTKEKPKKTGGRRFGIDAEMHCLDHGISPCRVFDSRHGHCSNWDDFEALTLAALYSQDFDPETVGIMASEHPMTIKACREKQCQIMFEALNIERYYVGVTSVLSLYASGRTTGVVVDAGDSETRTVPVYEGYALPHAILRNNDVGSCTERMLEILLRACGGKNELLERDPMNIARLAKERLAYVSLDMAAERRQLDAIAAGRPQKKIAFELPDLSVIEVDESDRMAVGECAVSSSCRDPPYLAAEMVKTTIGHCDTDIRMDCWGNIVLSGGPSCLPGYLSRLRKDLLPLAPTSVQSRVKIIAPSDRGLSVWPRCPSRTCCSRPSTCWAVARRCEDCRCAPTGAR